MELSPDLFSSRRVPDSSTISIANNQPLRSINPHHEVHHRCHARCCCLGILRAEGIWKGTSLERAIFSTFGTGALAVNGCWRGSWKARVWFSHPTVCSLFCYALLTCGNESFLPPPTLLRLASLNAFIVDCFFFSLSLSLSLGICGCGCCVCVIFLGCQGCRWCWCRCVHCGHPRVCWRCRCR